jgi:hypothetical protein
MPNAISRRDLLAGLPLQAGSASPYVKPATGRVFRSLAEGRRTAPGDTILIRDLAHLAPAYAWSETKTRGKWHLRPYQLADGQRGRLLLVNDVHAPAPASAIPPEFEIKLDLPGWYALWFGVPRLDLRPRISGTLDGVDVALDGEEGFVQMGAERGTRQGRIMGPMDVEIQCFWKCARLDGRTLRIRVPFGTFLSHPWGLVRGGLSALALVKLSEAQAREYQRDISDPSTKRVIVVHDGFSHYFNAAPTTGIDARTVATYRDSDVKMLIYQTPSTGIASWPSRATSIIGDGMTEALWKQRRLGDRRAYDYVQWAIRNRQESIGVVARLSRQAGIQCHAGLRMNLFFRADSHMGEALPEYFNGAFWRAHPELRNPGRSQLDYARPEVRRYILGILTELATQYDVDGISLDFTRWPPIADPERHDLNVLTSFLRETRRQLDAVGRNKRRRLALSAAVVDGYHAKMTLIEQRIDLEAWLAGGCLDFVCVQAWDHARYLAWAKRSHTPYYAVQDQNRFEVSVPSSLDPEWQQKERPDEDPLPGEERQSQPHVNSSLDPTEYDRGFLKRYQEGVDGVCLHNNFLGGRFTGRLGHLDEMAERARTGEIWAQVVGPAMRLL